MYCYTATHYILAYTHSHYNHCSGTSCYGLEYCLDIVGLCYIRLDKGEDESDLSYDTVISFTPGTSLPLLVLSLDTEE